LKMVINIPMPSRGATDTQSYEDEYLIRRKTVEFGIPIITNLQLAETYADAIEELREEGIVDNKSYHEKIKIFSLHEYLDDIPPKKKYW